MTLAVCEDSKEEEGGGGGSASRQTTAAVVASAGMLLQRFLARLSGRRRQQRRHVRRFRSSSSSSGPGARAAAGGGSGGSGQRRNSPQPQQPQQPQRRPVAMEQPEEEELLLRLASVSCSRCRSGRSCSCAALGLDQVDDDEDVDEENREHGRTRQRCADGRTTYDGCWREARQQDCGCADRDVLRRRPPEDDREEDQEQRQRCWRRPPTGTTTKTAPGTSRRLLPQSSYYLATLLLLSYSFVGMADACSSRSTPKPRPPTPTPRPNITFHMYTCPPDYAEWYCLNGATCFTVKIVDSLLYNCLCANGYIGQRCEFKDLDGSYLPSRQRVMLETASIAGAVTIAVFLAVITFISVYIHCKRKQKELRTSSGVDAVDGVGRDPELRPFCSRSRSLMTTFMAKNPNSSTTAPSIEQTRMPNWNYPAEASTRMCSVNENKRPSQ